MKPLPKMDVKDMEAYANLMRGLDVGSLKETDPDEYYASELVDRLDDSWQIVLRSQRERAAKAAAKLK